MALQHIPPIQCLLTFEAVARLRHAGRAAYNYREGYGAAFEVVLPRAPLED